MIYDSDISAKRTKLLNFRVLVTPPLVVTVLVPFVLQPSFIHLAESYKFEGVVRDKIT